MTAWFARLWISLINATAGWRLATRARLGNMLGNLLWMIVRPRRRVTLANLRACFPDRSEAERRAIARACFRNVGRGVLDHGVLWKGTRDEVRRLVRCEGLDATLALARAGPVIVMAPHFVGLDAGAIRLATEMRAVSIYARQSNPAWDEALTAGRGRFNDQLLLARSDEGAMRRALRALKSGLPMYYLPDMDHGPHNSIFVPFFGVAAATLPMLPRLAKLAGARVVTAVTEMTDDGYVVHLGEPWADFPTGSIEADTARMNREIERWVLRLPTQYLWTHRRFKTRPPGAAPIY
ncbi:MAG: lipid A biosynthesis acyltransferase [Gemmatimonadota bacterium]